eukprot:1607_1
MAELWWTITLIISLFIMICALSSAVDINAFLQKLKKPKGIIIGLICQYAVLPLIAFGLCYLFKYDYESSVALILTATCPGGILSNAFAFAIGADLPLSIAMTTASSILSFAFIPLNCFIYIELGLNSSSSVNIDWSGLMTSIIVLIVGIVVGLLFAWKQVKYARQILGMLATLCLMYVVSVSLYDNFTSDYPLWKLTWEYYIGPLLLTLFGWIFGLIFALFWKMKKSSAVSVGIETSNQSTGVAIAILALSIPDIQIYDRVVAIPGIYTLLTWAVNGIFVVIFLKLGWVDEETDESVTCCTLIKKYKYRNKQDKEYVYDSDQERDDHEYENKNGVNENVNIELKNTDGHHQTNIVVTNDEEEQCFLNVES